MVTFSRLVDMMICWGMPCADRPRSGDLTLWGDCVPMPKLTTLETTVCVGFCPLEHELISFHLRFGKGNLANSRVSQQPKSCNEEDAHLFQLSHDWTILRTKKWLMHLLNSPRFRESQLIHSGWLKISGTLVKYQMLMAKFQSCPAEMLRWFQPLCPRDGLSSGKRLHKLGKLT